MPKSHAAAVRADTRWVLENPPCLGGVRLPEIITSEYDPLVKAVQQAVTDLRFTQVVTGNSRVANYLEKALREVVGDA